MRRRLLIGLLAAAVVCAGAGVALSGNPFAAATFGWTAYSPLSATAYVPGDLAWLTWAPRLGVALLTLGAGTAGAVLTALILRRPARTPTTAADRSPDDRGR